MTMRAASWAALLAMVIGKEVVNLVLIAGF